MMIGDLLHGFRVERIRPIQEVEGELIEMKHEQTGAELCWLKRADVNKTFYVAFETLPEDDTGVFHILEHSVLCGSDLYQVREPFVELLKCSMNTFLNAITFGDKTMYPVASRNEKDFFNLMKVYLDAVFHPAIYTNPNIFRQEGWHVHLEEGKAPAYQGVVFNEMKGALSSADSLVWLEMSRTLFPDSPYGCESGGDPVHIPELTYEQFLDCHRRFYHPSNARFFLDGEVPLDAALAMINDEYLCHYQAQPLDFSLTMQQDVPACEKTVHYAIGPGEDAKNKCYYAMGRILCTWQEQEKRLAANALCDYLTGSNEAPLKKALLKRGLAQDVQMSIDSSAQSMLVLNVMNTDEDKFDAIRAAIREVAEAECSHGLNLADMNATINRMEFRTREWREPAGLRMGIAMLDSWLYGGDPAMYLQTAEVYQGLREKLNTDYYTELLCMMLLDDAHLAVIKALPSDTLTEEQQAAEQARLDALMASWSVEEQQAAEHAMQELNTWQKTPDSEEALASLPHLTLADVAPLPEKPVYTVETLDGVQVIRSESRASGLTYLNLYFRMTDLTLEELPKAAMMANLLGNLATAKHTAGELKQQVKTYLGKLAFGVEPLEMVGADGKIQPMLTVSCSVLNEYVDEAVRLIVEVLTETCFDDVDNVRDLFQQRDLRMRQGIMQSGHYYGMVRAASHESMQGAALDAMVGYGMYQQLHATMAAFDAEKDALLQQLKALYAKVAVSARLAMGVSGVMSDEQVRRLLAALPMGEAVPATAAYAVSGQAKEGIVVPSGVSYAAMAANLCRMGSKLNGSHKVLANIASYQYLWNVVRVQGGAYGVGLNAQLPGMLQYYSYRDPTPGRSLDMFRGTAAFTREFCGSKAALDQLIIGSVASTEPLRSASDYAAMIARNVLSGYTYEMECEERARMLSTTMDDLMACCNELEQTAAQGSVCVIGSKDALSKVTDELTMLDF